MILGGLEIVQVIGAKKSFFIHPERSLNQKNLNYKIIACAGFYCLGCDLGKLGRAGSSVYRQWVKSNIFN